MLENRPGGPADPFDPPLEALGASSVGEDVIATRTVHNPEMGGDHVGGPFRLEFARFGGKIRPVALGPEVEENVGPFVSEGDERPGR